MRRITTMVVMLAALGTLLGASSASANEPWWHITTVAGPPRTAGEESRIVLDVGNLGDSDVVASAADPVRIVDKLPAGVTATHIYIEYGDGQGAESAYYPDPYQSGACTLATLTCVFEGGVLSYERLIVAIRVRSEPGAGDGVNEVGVSGGNAVPRSSRRALGLERPPSQYGAENYELAPEEEGGVPDTQAGSHPFQLTTTLVLNTVSERIFELGSGTLQPAEFTPELVPAAYTKDLRFNLPAGLVGNPTPLPKCSMYTFTHEGELGVGECPANTVVGVAMPIVTTLETRYTPLFISLPLYSLEPSVGEPARFGFQTPLGPVVLDTSVRTGGSYPVVVTVPDITQKVAFLGNEVTFWGVPADTRHDNSRGRTCLDQPAEEPGKAGGGWPASPAYWEKSCAPESKPQPFLIMPTSCTGPLQTSAEMDSWSAPGNFTPPKEYTFANDQGEPFGQDGCNRLTFEPSVSVTPDGQAASTPTGLTVDVHVPQEASLNPTGVDESTVKDTTVTLPEGVALNPASSDGLLACSTEQLSLETPAAISCPASSKVGTVEIATPLLPNPIVGGAYLAAQESNPFGSLLALYLVAEDPTAGVLVKFAGEIKPNPVTGQLVTTFDNTPQLPFEDLKLHFFGGERAPLGTPASCGSYTTSGSFAPWSGNPSAEVSSPPFEITSGANGTPCSDPLKFDPSLTAGTTNIQAAGFSQFTMTMSRESGQQNLQAIQLKMPAGLSGLLEGVELCPEPQADLGTCPPNSLIGETTVSVGLGGEPYTVKGGKVFITGPYEGAPFGLAILNPGKAGPFDLENTKTNHPPCDCVLVRAKIEVNPVTAELTITSDNSGPYKIPTILEGVPLEIQHVNVTINRPGFTFNPTDCNPSAVSGSLSSAQGATSAISVPFQVTDCAVLKFKPGFQVSTSSKTSRTHGASLSVKLTYPPNSLTKDANIKSVKVDLPKQLPSRLTTLQKACLAATFAANPAACPADSRVGQARALTPLLPVALEGPAYFVSYGGAKFPELVIVLQGDNVTLDVHGETFISKAGITSSTFHAIPDAPVGSFELTLPEGPYSALAANGNLCTSKLAMPTAFVAQNGDAIHQSTPIGVTGCPKHKSKAKNAKKAHGHRKGKKK